MFSDSEIEEVPAPVPPKIDLAHELKAFVDRCELREGVFKVDADKESITCTLCKSSFKGDDHKKTIKYARDHHNRVTGHMAKYLSHVDADVVVVRKDREGVQTYEEICNENFQMLCDNYGRGQFERDGDKALCKCGKLLNLAPTTGSFLTNILQHRRSRSCLASKHQQVSITKFFTSGPPDGANNS